jgi:hypothetical protein
MTPHRQNKERITVQPSFFRAQGVFPINEFLLTQEIISSENEEVHSSHLDPLVENRVVIEDDKEYELSHYSVPDSEKTLTIQATAWRRGELQITKTLRISVEGNQVKSCVQTQVPGNTPRTIMSTSMDKSEVRPADLIRW